MSSECDAQFISLVSYNVNLAYNDLSTPEKAENIANYLFEKDVDIVLLQEYNPQIFPILQQKLEKKYRYGSPYQLADRFKAVFSKYPISDFIQLKSPLTIDVEENEGEDRSYFPICGMKVIVGDKSFYLVNCHLHSNNLSTALREYRRNELSLVAFIMMMFSSLSQGIQERKQQVKSLREHISDIRHPLVICGDMNDVNGSSVMNFLRGNNLFDAWWTKGTGLGFTLSMKAMKWRLDHILVSDGIKIKSILVDKTDMSDHRPLLCKFQLIANKYESSI